MNLDGMSFVLYKVGTRLGHRMIRIFLDVIKFTLFIIEHQIKWYKGKGKAVL